MMARACICAAFALCGASVYFNRRSDAWADRCLYLAYAALFAGFVTVWR